VPLVLRARRHPAATRAAGLVVCLWAILTIDHFASRESQLLLGGATVLLLVALSTRLSAELRAQLAIVVAMATCFEVLGSIIWGVYRYRLGNLPLFVPPAHGLVYLAGVAISRTEFARRRPRRFVTFVVLFASAWGVLGLTGLLGRIDVIGGFGVLVFCVFLLRSSSPMTLGGVFFVVAALEIYGTALGTWAWAPIVPGMGVPDGNPPSGAASGYVLFDLAALAFFPRLLLLAARLGTVPHLIAAPTAGRVPMARHAATAPGGE